MKKIVSFVAQGVDMTWLQVPAVFWKATKTLEPALIGGSQTGPTFNTWTAFWTVLLPMALETVTLTV